MPRRIPLSTRHFSKSGACQGRRGWLACALLLATAAVRGAEPPSLLVAQPLAPRSGPRGATLFAPVTSEDSGVRTENNYADPDMWGRRAREFDLGGIGTGVAVGDFDGDSLPDLFVVSKTESCRLFRNLGGWKFEEVTEKAGVGDTGAAATTWKQGATFADVNNDGRLDLYVCRFNAPNLLYVNQGDGTFKEQGKAAGLDVTDASVMAVFGDYDRDGWLDVFVQTNVLDAIASPEGQRDYLFHNNRDGTFTEVGARAGVTPGPTHGNSALWWDADDDGWPDLYVANDFAVPDALYHNNHDGTFTNVITQSMPRVAYSSMGSDFADVDNDGHLDVFVADMASPDHVKDQRTMAETRARLRLPDTNSGEVPQFPCNALLLNTGTGRFLEASHLAGLSATDWTWSPRWEDFDEDGRVDVHITNGMYREIHNQDLIGRRMAAENPGVRAQLSRNSPVLAESHYAFRNLGSLEFENVSAAWGLDQTGVSFGSATADFDGDGDLDIVYCNYQKGVTLLRNDNAGTHHVIVALRGVRSNRFGVGARVSLVTGAGRQVRELQPDRGFMSSSEPVVHFGLGDETTIQRLEVRWPSGTLQVFEGVAADQRLTITEPDAATLPSGTPTPSAQPQFVETGASLGLKATVAVEPHDDFLDQRLLPFGLNRRGPTVGVADLDGSGRADVVLGGSTRDAVRVFKRGADGSWTLLDVPGLKTVPVVNDGPVLLFDAAGKGRADLLVAAGGTSEPAESPDNQPRLYFNDGAGHFEAAPPEALPALPVSAGALCAADFDGDGRVDVFVGGRVVPGAYPTTPVSALLANRGGTFEDVTERVAPELRHVGLVTAALWSDVDGDGLPDLLVALEWGNVRYFHNEAGRGFADWSEKAGFLAAGNGWWRSLASADFNGDGRPDFVVGNQGLNTPYQAEAGKPVVLFYGDFANRNSKEIVEAYYQNDRLYPRRSRSDVGASIPSVFRRYKANNDYAKATLPEILGAEKLAAATRFEATELRSGVFLSQPNGVYRFEPLPRLAQLAPANGLVVADFDGDGHTDVYVLHNSYAPAPAIGRFDGGLSLLLRGDGHGQFAPVPPSESGLVVPGDAKSAGLVDLNADGWPDLVVSRDEAPLLVFQNRGVAGHASLKVVLSGRPGNATAVGACVTAVYADGSQASVEIQAGSGGASQENAVYLGYTRENPLREVRVRWPSREVTTTRIDSATTQPVLRLSAP